MQYKSSWEFKIKVIIYIKVEKKENTPRGTDMDRFKMRKRFLMYPKFL